MLLSVSNVARAFGVDQVLDGVKFQLDLGEKVALVGRNGSGKTTLLRIITGADEPDAGSTNLARGAKIGYLRQEAPVGEGRTVLEEAQASLSHEIEIKRRLTELELKLEQSPTDEDIEEFSLLHERFMEAQGYSAERDIRAVLVHMGFTEDEFDKSTDQLSGGEKTRLALARMLLERPELLILDEPTNHLDLQATEWLESWLRKYNGAVLLVSHDREFLENTAERVLELRDGKVKAYPGPFAKYLKLRAEDEARQAEIAKRQAEEIARMDEYVRRFMNSQRTAQARGRQKQMNRLIENKVEAPKQERGMAAGFGKAARSGEIVAVCEKLEVGYASPLFPPLDWTVRFRDRWGVIGENGAGKSTLLKTILGELDPLAGEVRLGSKLNVGYFSQDTQELDLNRTPLEFMVWECDMLPGEARNLLGRFLITGDDVSRPIRTLSGGEKNKLSLARLTHLNPNLLVLDEPTNHLDMDSREALAQVLRGYRGTLILISHDRWLLGKVTAHTLDVRRSGVVRYGGAYPSYRRWQESGDIPAKPGAPRVASPGTTGGMSPRDLSKEIQRVGRLIEEIERQISEGEADLRGVEEILANLPPQADVIALTQEHQRLQDALAGSMSAWEEQSHALERLQALQG